MKSSFMNSTIIVAVAIAIGLAMSAVTLFFNNKIKDFPQPESKWQKVYLYATPVMTLAMTILMAVNYMEYVDLLISWRIAAFLPVLFSIAYVDHREKLILNEYLVALLIVRVVLIIPEFIFARGAILGLLLTELLCVAILFCFGFLLRFLSKKGMGMGDIKLFMVIPLFMGAANGLRSIFWGMVVMFIEAIFCLITKRKGRKDELPFAPALAAGTVVAAILMYI